MAPKGIADQMPQSDPPLNRFVRLCVKHRAMLAAVWEAAPNATIVATVIALSNSLRNIDKP